MSESYDDTFGPAFQEHLLATAALHPEFVHQYRTALSHEYFGDDSLRVISTALFKHVDEYDCVPTHSTLVEFAKAESQPDDHELIEARINTLYEHDISDSASVMAKAVEFGQRQALVNAVLSSAEDIDQNNGTVESLHSKIDDRIRAAQMVGQDLVNIGLDYGDVAARIAHYTDPEAESIRIPTGIGHLDFAMNGGLKKGNLGVVLAPPKRGKSTTLFNIGMGAMKAGFNVAHYTLEMDKEDVSERYDDCLMGQISKDLKKADPHAYVEQLQEAVATQISGNLFIQRYYTRACTVSMLRSHLALLRAKGFKPDVIIVDYADIMKADRRLGEMRHEQAGIYEDLRQMAGEFDVAIWTASQTSKVALDKDVVTIADFAESFEKAAIADAVWAFCQTDEERISGVARLFAAALRKSEDGRTVECKVRRDICRVTSTGLYDAAYQQVATPGDDEAEVAKANEADGEDEPKVTKTASHQSKVDAIKAETGITKPKKGKKGAPAKPGQPTPKPGNKGRKIGVKPGSIKEKANGGGKKGKKPSKVVGDN